jgi:NAD(P)-dependent dehydrogenase (short-subunit alcohol dehydrogenase family)
MMNMSKPITVITGASSGIGEALAYHLAAQGGALALAARRAEALEKVAQGCRERGGQAITIPTDVTQADDCRRLIEHTIAAYGRLDTLVNNAGVSMWARVMDLPEPTVLTQVMQVNLLGTMYCTHAALPHLIQSQGRIACISSMAATLIVPGNTAYVASKLGLQGFCESLRAELEGTGVSISLIHLGFVDTGIADHMLDAEGKPGRSISHLIGPQMTPQAAAALIDQVTQARRRTVYTPVNGVPGVLLPWLKLLAPGLLVRIGRRFWERSQE